MMGFQSTQGIRKYLHCGGCWKVLGEIPASDSEREFDTFDCSWSCDCGRLNLSSDGVIDRRDNKGNIHYVYVRGSEERSLVERISNSFDFDRRNFNPKRFN